jgi:dTDP-4-amino-4,6-dideoxygalactose transaminase
MDVSQVEAAITPRTKAILPVHLYGQLVEMKPLMELAAKYHLRVIEDACQAHGAKSNGSKAGSLGDAAAFSFYYSKNLGAYGEGGFITTNDPELYNRVRMIRDHGSERRYYHDLVGMNARLDEIQAVVLRAKLPHLEKWNQLRLAHAHLYNQLLRGAPAATPVEREGNTHIYHLYVVRVPRRDELQAWLKERGIFTGIHYPVPNHLQPALKFLGYQEGDLPATEQAVKEIISLPMFAELTDEEIGTVVNSVKEFYIYE